MPRVPTAEQQSTVSQPLPGVRATPDLQTHTPVKVLDTFNVDQQARLAQGLGNLGQSVLQIQQQEQAKADQVRVNDAMNQAIEARLNLTYGPQGYAQLKGKDALERPDGVSLPDEYHQQLKTKLDEIGAGLGNENQKRAFGLQSSQMAVQFKGDTTRYTFGQFDEYQKSVQDGTIKIAQQQMGLSWGDPEAVNQSKEAIKASVYQLGKQQGWSGAQVEAITNAQLSVGHATVIAEAANAGNLKYANEYFAQNKGEMLAEARLHAEKTLELGGLEERTQEAAGKLYAESKGDIAGALAAARQQYKGKEEDAIVHRIKTLDGERVALRERAQADAADSAWRVYASTGSLSRIPPSTLAAMDGKALEGLRRTARADADAALAKQEVKTDPNVYYFLSRASVENPNFGGEDLRLYFDRLSPADRKHFVDLQSKMSKPTESPQVVGVAAQKEAVIKSLSLKGEQAGIFMQQADKALFAAEQEKGKKLDQTERQKVLDRLVLQGEVLSGHWYQNDPNMRLFEAIASGQQAQFKAEFSDADRRRATAALQRQGVKNPTKQQIDKVLQEAYRVQ